MKKISSILMLFFCVYTANIQAQIVEDTTNFEDQGLAQDSYWNGSDESGGFVSGDFFFPNAYNPDWGSWSRWACSSMSDDTTAGYLNLYSAITASGFEPENSGGSTYGLCNVPMDFMTSETIPVSLLLQGNEASEVAGFYVTNSTYATLSMEHGDDFAKKFGGESGDDPDWFKLSIWAYSEGTETDTLEFYLADFRFEDNNLDYIVKDWEWVELSSLGQTDSLMFNLSSSDVGDYGMNTPAYFCVDHIITKKDVSGMNELAANPGSYRDMQIRAWPNPSSGAFRIGMQAEKALLQVLDVRGRIVCKNKNYEVNQPLDLSGLPAGVYLLRLVSEEGVGTGLLVRE
ncbi:MAG: DUF4465 domain-containing protein [Bacteroidota bacterium]|nr:DUF4465 domain-containing protein [Bacteroidota bacterium]